MEDNKTQFDWKLIDGTSVSRKEIRKAYHSVISKIRRYEIGNNIDIRRIPNRTIFLFTGAAVAAIILINIFTIGLFKSSSVKSVPAKIAMIEYSASNGEIRTVTLPDKTTVQLNSGSVLFCPAGFTADERAVHLSGEAVFDVTKNPDCPFVVNTSDMSIKVLGTKFNVKAYPNENRTVATLCRGKIAASLTNEDAETITMVPGEEYSFSRNSHETTLRQVNPNDAISWTTGQLNFQSENIYEIISTLQRKFDVNIYLSTDSYNEELITAKFSHGESLKDVMEALSVLIPGMSFEISGSNLYIR